MATTDNTFSITIEGFEGLAPAYYSNDWSSFGNKGSANNAIDVDISDPSVLTQGSSTIPLTSGTQAGSVTTLITSIMKGAVSSDTTFAVGGNKVYKISNTAVASTGGFPATIDKAVVTDETITDIVFYKDYLYAFYNHSGSLGDVAKITTSNGTVDATWGSVTGGGTLNYAPHYAINGGNDMIGFTNGTYVSTIDGTTFGLDLDLPSNSQADTITWNGDYFLIGVNRPSVSGANYNESAIYTWDGFATSWNVAPISVSGKIGALFTHNGITYIWWKDNNGTGGCNFGYLNGSTLTTIKRYDGDLPDQSQVCDYLGFIVWNNGDEIMVWGAGDNETTVKFFPYMSATHSTVGSISAPFGTLLISSTGVVETVTQYYLSKESGYSTDAEWETIVFNLLSPTGIANIKNIKILTEQIGTGGKLDTTIYYNQGKYSKALNQIAYNTDNNIQFEVLNTSIPLIDFRLKLDWSNGSKTNPVKVRAIYISGNYVNKNGTI